ncbi:hypothetical protein OSSY52_15950 [Tepiditoga spiralis]|uniref:Osmotically inducible protein C n=1 Tax=Tepiditoga spiralis TaxID=2108365 RepID=A0A7G1G8A0_9BACT|nr:OsmC family protein [Tepiditoga spiralis]BBE31454.1 hypothetical protein OSSY52_15950 [Tepiditoga spiralis]
MIQKFVLETTLHPEESVSLHKARGLETKISVNTEGKHTHAHTPVETVIGALGSCLIINTQRFFKAKELNFKDIKMTLNGYRDPSIPKLVKIEYFMKIETNETINLDELKEFISKKSTTYRTLEDSVEIVGEIEKI